MQHSTTDVNEVLADRAKDYGNYGDIVSCRATILDALNDAHIARRGKPLPYDMQVMFGDIALKLTRLAVNPKHKDSYVDLLGYATIIKEFKVGQIEIEEIIEEIKDGPLPASEYFDTLQDESKGKGIGRVPKDYLGVAEEGQAICATADDFIKAFVKLRKWQNVSN